LHEEGRLEPFAGASWLVAYPSVAWVAVMAAVLARTVGHPRGERRTRFLRTVAAFTLTNAVVGFRSRPAFIASAPGMMPCETAWEKKMDILLRTL